MKKVFLFASTAGFVLGSCKKDNDKKADAVFKGEVKEFQHGKAWAWFELER